MLNVVKLNPSAVVPTVAHPGEDLAYDLYALEDRLLVPGVLTTVPTGIAAQFTMMFGDRPGPKYGFLIRDRSSMAKAGIMVSGGVVDAGYTGEIVVMLTNMRRPTYDIILPTIMLSPTIDNIKVVPREGEGILVKQGDKIAQIIPMVSYTNTGIREVEYIEGERGAKGFGSTGK